MGVECSAGFKCRVSPKRAIYHAEVVGGNIDTSSKSRRVVGEHTVDDTRLMTGTPQTTAGVAASILGKPTIADSNRAATTLDRPAEPPPTGDCKPVKNGTWSLGALKIKCRCVAFAVNDTVAEPVLATNGDLARPELQVSVARTGVRTIGHQYEITVNRSGIDPFLNRRILAGNPKDIGDMQDNLQRSRGVESESPSD
jgi:hypothetical protein